MVATAVTTKEAVDTAKTIAAGATAVDVTKGGRGRVAGATTMEGGMTMADGMTMAGVTTMVAGTAVVEDVVDATRKEGISRVVVVVVINMAGAMTAAMVVDVVVGGVAGEAVVVDEGMGAIMTRKGAKRSGDGLPLL